MEAPMTMSVSRSIRAAAIAVVLVFGAWLAMRPPAVAALAAPRQATVSSLPDRLRDAEFWSLVSNISEPGGSFRISDNFTSNELEVGRVFTMLRQRGVRQSLALAWACANGVRRSAANRSLRSLEGNAVCHPSCWRSRSRS